MIACMPCRIWRAFSTAHYIASNKPCPLPLPLPWTTACWVPSITIRQILLGIQELLDTPNLNSPAQTDAYKALKDTPKEYERRVRALRDKYGADVVVE